jgi:tetratricopeptide (TPR) repeat protein
MVKNKSLPLLLLLCFFIPVFGRSVDWEKVHNLTNQGIEELYGLKINAAVEYFDEVSSIAPNDPRGHFFKAMAFYYKYFLLSEKEDFDKFVKASDDVISICERHLKYNTSQVEQAKTFFYLGGIKGYRGIIRTLYTSGPPSLSVLKEGKEAFEALDKAIKLNPELYDAYMGFGLFTYIIGSLPKAFRWIASIIGFEGDKKKGIEYLRIANEKGLYTKYEALWWLTFFYMGENDDENASKSLDAVLKKFPTNTLYLVLMGNFQMSMNKIDRAFEYFSRASVVQAPEMKKLTYFASVGLGRYYFVKNNFAEAIKHYENFINLVPEKEDRWRNRDNALYNLGLCYDNLGQREKAISYFQQVKYNDFAFLRVNNPLTIHQKIILQTYNNGIASGHNKAIEELEKIAIQENLNTDEFAYARYMLASLYYSNKNYKTAFTIFREIQSVKTEKENWLKPYSKYYIGQCLVNIGDISSAKKEFEYIEDFKDYYGERSLKRMTKRAIDKLD